MKKTLLTTLSLLMLSWGASAQNVNIPDTNFKACLVGDQTINTNNDSEIQVSEAAAFTGSISCNALNITDLTGIEAFTAATQLNVSQNNLQNLDISQNTELIGLVCHSNEISVLDLSQNTALTVINCNTNSLSALDVSPCTGLGILYCNGNNISSLDVSYCPGLYRLYCSDNSLTSLNMKNLSPSTINDQFDATSNPNLTCIKVDDATEATAYWVNNIDATASFDEICCNTVVNIPDANFKAYLVGNTAINTNNDGEIQCSEATAFTGTIQPPAFSINDATGIETFTNVTQIIIEDQTNLTSLDVSQNTNVTLMYVANNSLSSLDLSNNTSLEILACSKNNLTALDLSNNVNLTSLFCAENNITVLNLSQNPNLTQVGCNKNNLTYLNLKSVSTTAFLNASENASLTCIEVDDVAAAETNWTNIDAASSFSTDCGISGIDQEYLQNLITLYPNPTTSFIHIDASININAIVIFNALGESISVPATQKSVNVADLATGIYTLQLHTDAGSVTKKFFKE